MEAASTRKVLPGRQYDHLFPKALNNIRLIKANASLDDTIRFIHEVIGGTLEHTRQFIPEVTGSNLYDTCRNIWNFVFRHIKYKKDQAGTEQIRSPRRTWADRSTGVDCDCYTVFICSILANLRIPYKLRITKYREDRFQHIYPIVPTGSRHIAMDCVTDRFDFEVPFSEAKDINMDLQYLDGLGAGRGDDLVFDGYENEIGSLGGKPKKKKKKRGFFKKLLSKVNKINPVTVLLRNGFLAAMKVNLFKVASRIKYAYLTPEQAVQRGILPDKFEKLVNTREKLESIFETAGGNPKNLKKAILKGKGNKNKEVALSGFLPDDGVLGIDVNTPLPELLGADIYHDENIAGMEGFEGFGELGEPVTGAAIAAASGAVAAIAKILKGIGNIFGGNQKGSEDFSEENADAADKEIANTPSASKAPAGLPEPSAPDNPSYPPAKTTKLSNSLVADSTADDLSPSPGSPGQSESGQLPVAAGLVNAQSPVPSQEQGNFWTKNKKWLIPTAIGATGLAAIVIVAKMAKSGKHPPTPTRPLEGAPSKKRGHHKKKPVALM